MTTAARRGTPQRAARPELVYRKLRELIVRGQLAPGSRIVETDVSQRLGVSRTPVRGALQRLQQEGYIVDSPSLQQSRPTVAPLTNEDAHELFSILAEVEGLAARFAAQLPAAEREALAAELTEINAQFKKAAEAKQPNHNRLWELDERFHCRYVEAAAGPRLLALFEAVKPQAERYERIYVSLLVRDLKSSVSEHAVIVRAIKSGNPDAAQAAVQTNWRNAAQRLGAVITNVGERGQW
ncbi:MAG: GntR family transcriptional regulator [Gemmatimonadetes bacterium]|nr:GntR family transcriptional regulator [Gemmatimonadota bacterium]